MNKFEYNLKVIQEGLKAICATPEERKAIFSASESLVDDNFDFIVLDFLGGAVEGGLVPKETAFSIESLFKEAGNVLSPLNWQQEDELLAANSPLVKQWQDKAAMYIVQINAHKQRHQRTP